MTVVKTSVFSVAKRFPERKETVIRLFNKSENFQSICEDYRKCAEALRHWNQSASEEASERREEYAALLQDLETEILHSLDELR